MSKGLSNEDFRMLMMTPRRTEGSELAASLDKTKKKRKHHKRTHHRNTKREDEDEFSWKTEGAYRDRAAERREQEKQDVEEEKPELEVGGFHAVAPPEQMNLKEKKQKIIEESKFLGGDMEHTHLVKGLDEALYEKRLQEMQKEQEKRQKEQEEQEEEEKEEELKTLEQQPFAVKRQKRKITFFTSIAKSIHYQLFGKTTPKKTDAFLPGRTSFIFDLNPNSTKDVPDINVHFKDEFLHSEEYTIEKLDPNILQQISTITSMVREGNHKPKEFKGDNIKDKNIEAQNEQSMKIEDTEEDIFAGVGEYVPDVERKTKDMEETKQKYFETSAFDENEMEIEQSTGGLPAMIKKIQQQQQQNKAKETTSKEGLKRKDPTYTDDGYDECYPGTYESSFTTLEGSDEEDDISKMDMGKKNRMRRGDFASEEAWSSYNDSREAMPRAAFQFGVKMNDGRKTRKNEGKKKEKKLDKELKKINSVIKERENMKSSVPTARELKKMKKK